MNLHALAVGAISSVNPMVPVSVRVSSGYSTAPDGTQVPTYAAPIDGVPAQIQALTFRDLAQVDGLNLQGTRRAIYVNGTLNGAVRVLVKGGDLIAFPAMNDFPAGSVWLVATVLEQWPDWAKVAATLQNDD